MKIKKITAILLFLLSVVLAVPMAGQGAAVPALQNAGFEGWSSSAALAAGWSVSKGGAALAAETADVTEGSLALRFTSGAAQTGESKAVQTVSGLTSDALYALSVDFKLTAALSSGCGFTMQIANSGGTALISPGAPVSHTDGDWMRLSYLFHAPSDGVLGITLSFFPDGKGERGLLLDNVQLGEAEEGKMELYKSPVGYVLPGVVTSETEAGKRLPEFYNGTVSLSGGRAAEKDEMVLVRFLTPDTDVLAIAGSYGETGEDLLDLAVFRTSRSFSAAMLTRGKIVRGFFWERGGVNPQKESEQLTFPENEKPIVQSGDFESYIGKIPRGWSAFSGWNGGFCFYETETETGNHRMRVTDTAGGSAPYVYRRIPVAPDTKYRFSVDCTQKDMTDKGAGVKLEYYNKDKEHLGDLTEKFSQSATRQSFELQTPPGTAEIAVLLRIYTAGTAYFDNVEMECLSTPPAGSVTTDEFFYYPEWGSGTASVIANTVSFPAAEKGTYDIALLDGSTVLTAETGRRLTDGEGTWSFPISLMKTEGKGYAIEATMYDESGQRLGSFHNTVYQYPRPTVLDENGEYRNTDGSLFIPKLAYHVAGQSDALTEEGKRNYQYAKDAGMNVIQLSTGCIYDPENTWEILNVLDGMGLKALIPLYDKRYAAGSAYHEKRTKALVEKVKNHPAVFAYGIYDEPAVGSDGLTEADLINSYRVIRDIDKKHPTYTVIAPGKSGSASMVRPNLTKYTDVICYDPYVACWDSEVSTYVQEVHEVAGLQVQHKRPLYSLLQVFDWREFFPTADEYRHMWYQAAFGGAKGIGIYSFNDALMDADGKYTIPLWTSDIWTDIKNFAGGEMQEAEKHFMHGEYPLFAKGETDAYRWHAWEKEGAVYMVILRTDPYTVTDTETAADVETSILLKSDDGKRQIGNFSAQCIYGGGKDANVTGNGTLSVKIGHRQALVYKISVQ